MERTVPSLMSELFVDLHARRKAILAEMAKGGPGHRDLSEELDDLEVTLGISPPNPDGAIRTGDPIVDAWERAIARGEDPDWSLGSPSR